MEQKTWQDAEIGDDLGSVVQVMSHEEINRYTESLDDADPWYREGSPWGGPIAPPLILVNEYIRLFKKKYHGGAWSGSLHSKMEFETIRPPLAGAVITTTGKIADKYLKRGRWSLVIETSSRDETGEEIVKSKMTLTFVR